MKLFKRSPKAIAGAAVLGLAVAGGAFAYFTSAGDGTGTAATGDTLGLVVTQDATTTYLMPGGSVPLGGWIRNPNADPVQFKSLTVVIDSVTQAAGAVGPCGVGNYSIGGFPSFDVAIIGGAVNLGGYTNPMQWYGSTLNMVNTQDAVVGGALVSGNQDGCKGATVNLKYTVVPK
jgi:hypothetical protein